MRKPVFVPDAQNINSPVPRNAGQEGSYASYSSLMDTCQSCGLVAAERDILGEVVGNIL
ncbi:MAG: hypothetical protein ACLR1V_10265 [Coprococcus sp.]